MEGKKVFSKEDVARIVEIVAGQRCSYEDIITNIAKNDPAVLLMAVSHEQGNAKVVYDYLRQNPLCNKIEAIKHVRCETSIGLKEAKDLIEEIADKYDFKFQQFQSY